jgi:hypothetical protein
MLRNTEPRILLLEAAILVYSFTAVAFHSDRPSIAGDPWGLARLAIPVLAALSGLLLRNRYTEQPRAPHSTVIDVAVAFGFALAAQAALSAFKPDLALPRWAPTQGGLLGMILLAISRSLFPPGTTALAVGFPKSARWFYLAAAAVFGLFALHPLFTGGARLRVAAAILLAGSVYLVCLIQRPDSLLRRTSYWYYGSLFPACALFLFESRVYEHLLLPLILMAAELNHRAETMKNSY